MDLLTAYLKDQEIQETWERITATITRALDPFIPGKIEFWYEDNLHMPEVLKVTGRIENLGDVQLLFDKYALGSSYLSPLDLILIELEDKIRNRPAVPVDNPNIILGEQ